VNTAGDDWKKLKTVCPKYPSVKRGYLLYVARRLDHVFQLEESLGKCRLHLIKLILSDYIPHFHEWDKRYLERMRFTVVPKANTKKAAAGHHH